MPIRLTLIRTRVYTFPNEFELFDFSAFAFAFRRGFIFSTPKRGGDPRLPHEGRRGGKPAEGADKADPAQSTEGYAFVRSVIALWLVLGLLMLAVLSFAYGNENLQSTIFGAVTVSAGGAIAFYFSTKAASEARRDLMQVADGLVFVPDVTHKTVDNARAIFAKQPDLVLDSDSYDGKMIVTSQSPGPGQRLARGSTVTVTAEAPRRSAEAAEPPNDRTDRPGGREQPGGTRNR